MSVDVTRSLQAAADQWVQERDDLAVLMLHALDNQHPHALVDASPSRLDPSRNPLAHVLIDGDVDLVALADAILAAGWRRVRDGQG
jgi:hypothetical protein